MRRRILSVYASGVLLGLEGLLRVLYLKGVFGDELLVRYHVLNVFYLIGLCFTSAFLGGLVYDKVMSTRGLRVFAVILLLFYSVMAFVLGDISLLIQWLTLWVVFYNDYTLEVVYRRGVYSNFAGLQALHGLIVGVVWYLLFPVMRGVVSVTVAIFLSNLLLELLYGGWLRYRFGVLIRDVFFYAGESFWGDLRRLWGMFLRKPGPVTTLLTDYIITAVVLPGVVLGTAVNYVILMGVLGVLRAGCSRVKNLHKHELVKDLHYRNGFMPLIYGVNVLIFMVVSYYYSMGDSLLWFSFTLNIVFGMLIPFIFWNRHEVLIVRSGLERYLVGVSIMDSMVRVLVVWLFRNVYGVLLATAIGMLVSTFGLWFLAGVGRNILVCEIKE